MIVVTCLRHGKIIPDVKVGSEHYFRHKKLLNLINFCINNSIFNRGNDNKNNFIKNLEEICLFNNHCIKDKPILFKKTIRILSFLFDKILTGLLSREIWSINNVHTRRFCKERHLTERNKKNPTPHALEKLKGQILSLTMKTYTTFSPGTIHFHFKPSILLKHIRAKLEDCFACGSVRSCFSFSFFSFFFLRGDLS